MMYALKKDIQGDPLQAIVAYESLRSDCPMVDELVYVNLSFIYWLIASDYGYYSSHLNVSEELWIHAGEEYSNVVAEGIAAYPRSLELALWYRYIPSRLLYTPFTREECEQLVSKFKGDSPLIPFFYLYLFDELKYQKERQLLKEQCMKLQTIKNNYILSLIQ